MIHVSIVLLTALAFYLLQDLIYRKYWDKNLSIDVRYQSSAVFEGETVGLTEKVSNGKLLPLPYLNLNYNQSLSLEQINSAGKPLYIGKDRNTMFTIPGKKTTVINTLLLCKKRGYYQMTGASVSSASLFLSRNMNRKMAIKSALTVYPKEIDVDDMAVPYKKLYGDVLAKRFILPDPFEFSGVREYQPFDSFRQINFKAWAKTGELMSNVYGFTVTQEIHIILNLQNCFIARRDWVFEQSIRLAAFLARYYIGQNISVSFYTNAVDCITGGASRVSGGSASGHLQEIYEALARIDIGGNPPPLVDGLPESFSGDETVVLISPYSGGDVVKWFESALGAGTTVMWVLPCALSGRIPLPHEKAVVWEAPEDE